MKKLILLLLITVVTVHLAQLTAQCTTAAGSIDTAPIERCAGEALSIAITSAPVLDANDLVRYLAYTGVSPQSGIILGSSEDGNFPYNPLWLNNTGFSVAAVAGNNNGAGSIDFSDPCLSVSAPVPVTYRPVPIVSVVGLNTICTGQSSILTAANNLPNSSFEWFSSTGPIAISPTVMVLTSGVYTVVVTSAAGCTASATSVLTVNSPGPIVVVNNTPCNETDINLGLADPPVGSGVFTYLWQGPAGLTTTTQNLYLNNQAPGNYCVTVTNDVGCTTFDCFELIPPLSANLDSNSIVVLGCEPITELPAFEVTGGVPPYTYQWAYNNGSVMPGVPSGAPQAGTYGITATDAAGCSRTTRLTIIGSPADACTVLRGTAFYDINENCQRDPGEVGVAGTIAELSGLSNFYGVSDSSGNYKMFLLNSGEQFSFSATPLSALWELCPSLPSSFNITSDTLEIDIPLWPVAECPLLTVDLSTFALRRCFSDNWYLITCRNEGVTTAENAYVELDLDPFLSIVSSSSLYTITGNQQFRFELGTMAPGQVSTIELFINVSCDAELGQTHCSEARIYPNESCIPESPLWSGASVEVRAECVGNEVIFTIENVGNADMTVPLDYIVIEDGILMMQATEAGLLAGETKPLSYPANGSTWYLGVQQEVFHPNNSNLVAVALEGCTVNGQFSTGFMQQFNLDNPAPWSDLDCTANQGSYDPNDKLAMPTGYGPKHYIEPETDISYTIRFQNTGTDTAFTVVIRDTLNQWLNPNTFRLLGVSHPCKVEFQGQDLLVFRFEAPDFTGLPDSNVNLIGSNGFVKFSIRPKTNTPLETLIRNRAGIYFDFNEPIITNTVEHTIGRDFLVSLWTPLRPQYQLVAVPNPAADRVQISVSGVAAIGQFDLKIFDPSGRLVQQHSSQHPVFDITRNGLPAGQYTFTIGEQQQIIGSGQLIFE
jgi:hypothetical protein